MQHIPIARNGHNFIIGLAAALLGLGLVVGCGSANSVSTPPIETDSDGFKSISVSSLDFTLSWRVTQNSKIDVKMSAPTTGWVGVGFGGSVSMLNANIIVGYVDGNGNASVRDDFGTGTQAHGADTASGGGGTSNLEHTSGTETGGRTTLRFIMPLDSGDTKDTALVPGNSVRVIVAYGPNGADNFTSQHSSSARATTQISAL